MILIAFCLFSIFVVRGADPDPVPVIPTSPSEVNALDDFYTAMNGTGWRWGPESEGIPWNFSQPTPNPCFENWQGVNCMCDTAECNIIGIGLKRHNISGQLPDSLSGLTHLKSFVIPDNRATGSMPYTLQYMQHLEYIDLRSNLLTEMPEWIGQMPALRALNLSTNHINGTIPESIYNLTQLTYFFAQSNFIQGTISTGLVNLTNMITWDVGVNLLTGTFPQALCNMTNLKELRIQGNELNGTIPDCLSNLTSLAVLELSNNFFYGSLPLTLGNMSRMVIFYCDNNYFTGHIPDTMANMDYLSLVTFSNNLLTGGLPYGLGTNPNLLLLATTHCILRGTIPTSFGTLTYLDEIDFGDNLLSGPVANSFSNAFIHFIDVAQNMLTGPLPAVLLDRAIYFATGFNYLTGTLPLSYDIMPFMNFFDVNTNYLSGSLSTAFFSLGIINFLDLAYNMFTGTLSATMSSASNVELKQMVLKANFLHGPIPEVFGNFINLAELDLSKNRFTGTVPSALNNLTEIISLFIDSNQLTGSVTSLVNVTRQPYVTNIDISHNFFTGSIPTEPFRSKYLSSFAASCNCFDGTLPVEMCSAANLSVLVLDGLATATHCRTNLMPYLHVFVVEDGVLGTIPQCLFQLNNLRTLHLSGNGFTGTLPSNLTLPARFIDLVTSHNDLTGTIPLAFQLQLMRELDLSYNRFGGALDSNFNAIYPDNEIFLHVNRLSGSIPPKLKSVGTIKLLDGNIFYCDTERSELPSNDPHTPIYVCGSNAANYSVFTWLSLVGFLLIALASFVVYYHYKKDWEVIKTIKDYWFKIQEKLDVLRKSPSRQHQSTDDKRHLQTNDEYAIHRLGEFLDAVRRIFMIISVMIVGFLVPLYVGLSSYTSTYKHEYGWEVSAILLAGPVATALLLVAGGGIVVALYIMISSTYDKWRLEDAPFGGGSSVGDSTATMSGDDATKRESGATEIEQMQQRKMMVDYVQLGILSFMNLIVMIAIDCAYVYIILNYEVGIVTATQVCLAGFKIVWNEVVLWVMVPLTKVDWFDKVRMKVKRKIRRRRHNRTTASMLQMSTISRGTAGMNSSNFHEEESGGTETESISTVRTVIDALKAKYSLPDVKFLSFTTLLNNIIVPSAAIACVSSSCFYDALITPDEVSDEYFIEQCAVYLVNVDIDKCELYTLAPKQTTYNPPFTYSYQCASTITINYVAVFIYMFAATGVLWPFIKMCVHTYYHRLLPDNPNKKKLAAFLPSNFLGPDIEHLGRTFTLFAKEKMVVKILNFLAIIVAFGTIYPPLAIMGCVALCAMTYSEQYVLGYVLSTADSMGLRWYREELCRQCVGVEKYFRACCTQVFPFTFTVLGYLVFDTYGYTYGWRKGMIITPVFFIAPLLAIGAARYWILYQRKGETAQQSVPTKSKDAAEVQEDEEQPGDVSVVVNEAHSDIGYSMTVLVQNPILAVMEYASQEAKQEDGPTADPANEKP